MKGSMKITLFGFLFCSLLLICCSKENQTHFRVFLSNSSGHTIRVIPYVGGNPDNNMALTINNSDSVNIGDGYDRGFDEHSGFRSNRFSTVDSMVVVFDGIYRMVHYVNPPPVLNPKHYLYTSPRNLLNYLSYGYSSYKSSSHKQEDLYVFRFTAQDYLDAR